MTVDTRRSIAGGVWLSSLAAGVLLFGAVEPWSEALVAVLACAAALLCRPDLKAAPASVVGVAGGFVSLGGLALVQAARRASAVGPSVTGPTTIAPAQTLAFAARMVVCAATAWTGSKLCVSSRGLKRFLWFVFLLGCVVSAVGLIQLSAGNTRIYGLRAYASGFSPFGPFYNPNHAAALLSMSLFAGLGLLAERARSLKQQVRGGMGRSADAVAAAVVFALLLALLAAGFAAARSRGAFACATVAVCLWAMPSKGWRVAAALACAALAAAAGVWLWKSSPAFRSSLAIRASVWRRTAAIAADAPFFGWGLGSYARLFPAYQEHGLGGVVLQAHSEPLQLLAEGGVVACAFTLLFGQQFIAAVARRAAGPLDRALLWGLVAFGLHSLGEFNLQIPGNLLLAAAIAGAVAAAAPGSPRPLSDRRLPALGAVALAAAALLLGLRGFAWTQVALTRGTPDAKFGERAAWRLDGEPMHRLEALLAENDAEPGLATVHAARLRLPEAEAVLSADPLSWRSLAEISLLLGRLGRGSDAGQFSREAWAVKHG